MEYFLRISLSSVEKGPGFTGGVLVVSASALEASDLEAGVCGLVLLVKSRSLSTVLSIFSFLICISCFCMAWLVVARTGAG